MSRIYSLKCFGIFVEFLAGKSNFPKVEAFHNRFIQMSKKANRNTPGKSRKSRSESTKRNSQNVVKGNSGYDFAGRIRNCCISWHECVQKWEITNTTGLELATKIVNEQLQNL